MGNYELVSIVIPLYNSEQYIEECLQSILRQTYTKLEIIIVDDGSTDEGLNLCRKYEKDDPRIHLYTRQHGGVVKTRRYAIEHAKGKYIAFLDSDDRVQSGYIENMLACIVECDIVCASCYQEDKYGNRIIRKNSICEGNYHDAQAMQYIWENMIFTDRVDKDGVLPFMVGKLYKTDLVKKIIKLIPDTLKIYEDRLFNWLYLLECQAVNIVEIADYVYQCNLNSTMQSMEENYMTNLNELYITAKRFIEGRNERKIVIDKLQKFIANRLYLVPKFMDFSWNNRIIQYYVPYRVDKQDFIVLYGAGDVGIDYYRELISRLPRERIIWTDKNWVSIRSKIEEVQSLDQALNTEYTKVFVAVKDSRIATQMKNDLINLGVEPGKILWEEPIILKNL